MAGGGAHTSLPTIVHSRLDAERLADLASSQPRLWRACRVLKHDAASTVTLMSDVCESIVVKRQRLDRWRRRADAVLHGAPARRAWHGAHLLQSRGFSVPQPLAVLERRVAGLVRESTYVSRALPHPPLGEFWRDRATAWSLAQRRQFLGELAAFLRSFHGQGLYTGDLRDANLLVEEATSAAEHSQRRWRFYLVDLDRIRHVAALSRRRKYKNLVQLDRTLGRSVRQTERLYFLYQYLGSPLPPVEVRRNILRQLALLRRRKDREYAKRRAKLRKEPPHMTHTQGMPSLDARLARGEKDTHPGPPPRRRPVSCIIICYNEERTIRRCLDSVAWCDEIIVVDSFSTDRTAEICRGVATQVIQRPWPGYVKQKRFALSQVSHTWVLNIDADEEVSPALREEIQAILQRDPPAVDGYYIPRLVYYLGRWWRRGWYPSVRLRLFRKHRVRWGGRDPHEKVVPQGQTGRLDSDIYHYTYEDIRDHLQSVNWLTTTAAHELFQSKLRVGVSHLVLRPAWRFLRLYVVQGCAWYGIPGFFMSVTAGLYVFLKYAKLREDSLRSQASVRHDAPAADSTR